MQPRHPDITVELVGKDGNAFNFRMSEFLTHL